MDTFEDAAVDVGEFKVATAHDARGHLHKGIYGDVGESGLGATVLETGNKLAGETGAMEIDAHSHHSGRVEHAVDSGLGMVAHDKPAELQVCSHEPLRGIVPDADLAIVVFKIARICSGADVAPLPYHGVPEITVVRLVAVAEHDSVVDFTTHLAEGAESRTAVNLRTHPDFGVPTERQRAAEAASLHHLGVAADIDRAILKIDGAALHNGPLLYKEGGLTVAQFGVADHRGRTVGGDSRAAARVPHEIVDNLFGVQQKDIEHIADAARVVGRLAAITRIKTFEVAAQSVICPYAATVAKRVAHLQLRGLEGRGLVGQLVAGDEKSLLVFTAIEGKLLAQITHGIKRILARQEMLPFFAYRHQADPEGADRTRIGKREKILVNLMGVEKDYFHIMLILKLFKLIFETDEVFKIVS